MTERHYLASARRARRTAEQTIRLVLPGRQSAVLRLRGDRIFGRGGGIERVRRPWHSLSSRARHHRVQTVVAYTEYPLRIAPCHSRKVVTAT